MLVQENETNPFRLTLRKKEGNKEFSKGGENGSNGITMPPKGMSLNVSTEMIIILQIIYKNSIVCSQIIELL